MAQPYSYMAQSTQTPQQQQVKNNWGQPQNNGNGGYGSGQGGGGGGSSANVDYMQPQNNTAQSAQPGYNPANPTYQNEGGVQGQGSYDLYGNSSQWGSGFQQPTNQWNPGQALGGPQNYAPTAGQNVNAAQPQGFGEIYGKQFYDPKTYADKNSPQARMIENTLPLRQQGFNEYSNNRDFNEAARRYGLEYAETVYGNRYNQQLATRQQKSGEETAADASRLAWAGHSMNLRQGDRDYDLGQRAAGTAQYGADTTRMIGQGQLKNDATDSLRQYMLGNRGLDIQNTDSLRDYNLGNRSLDVQNTDSLRQYNLGNRAADTATFNAQTGRYEATTQRDLGNRNLDLGFLTQNQNNTLGQGRLALDSTDSLRNYNLGNRAADTNQYQAATQRTLGQQANQIDQMWKTGQLTNQQRDLALQEVAQQQRNTLDTRTQASLEDYRIRQMEQEATLMREQMAAENERARWSQFGRNQTPNARWARSWQ